MHRVRLELRQGLNLVLVQGMTAWHPPLAYGGRIHLHALGESGRLADALALLGFLLQNCVQEVGAQLVAVVTGLHELFWSHRHQLPGGSVSQQKVDELSRCYLKGPYASPKICRKNS